LCIDPIVVLLASFAGKATDTTDGTAIH
jgi:hypothetical protein